MLRKGERVRILEIHDSDDDPGAGPDGSPLRPGDVVTLTQNTLDAVPGGYEPGFLWVTYAGGNGRTGETVARVERVEERRDAGADAVDAALAVGIDHGATPGTLHDHIGAEIPARPVPPVFMSTDSALRKLMPVASGVMKYFPDAILLCAWISRAGNDKHNPGESLHWAKEKSTDEPDCEARHMLDFFRDLPPDPGLEPLGRLGHLASKFWRAAAHLQRECDKDRAAYEAALAEWTAKYGRPDPVG